MSLKIASHVQALLLAIEEEVELRVSASLDEIVEQLSRRHGIAKDGTRAGRPPGPVPVFVPELAESEPGFTPEAAPPADPSDGVAHVMSPTPRTPANDPVMGEAIIQLTRSLHRFKRDGAPMVMKDLIDPLDLAAVWTKQALCGYFAGPKLTTVGLWFSLLETLGFEFEKSPRKKGSTQTLKLVKKPDWYGTGIAVGKPFQTSLLPNVVRRARSRLNGTQAPVPTPETPPEPAPAQ